jgi:hypothetical protein
MRAVYGLGMVDFAYRAFPHPIRDDISAGHRTVWAALAAPGVWWTAAERVAIAREVRTARDRRADPPWLRPSPDAARANDVLSAAAVEAVHRIAIDAHRLDREWTHKMLEVLGDAPYVELAAVVAWISAIDTFADALGVEHEPLPEPTAGEPSRARPDGVGPDGAWVPMSVPWQGPNVARALSLVPPAQAVFFALVGPMYALGDFAKLVWQDRPLTRPQVELVAARVSSVNECFY